MKLSFRKIPSVFRKAVSLVLCLTTAMFVPVLGGAASDVITVTPDFVISLGGNFALEAAANKLAQYLEPILGASLSVVSDASGKRAIVLAVDGSIDSGYTIAEKDGSILISGSDLRDTVNGVFGFLEKYCGIHCYTSEVTKYTADSVKVPVGESYAYTPYFEYTETDWYSPKFIDYSLFNGLSGGEYRDMPAELGGSVEYISSLAHTLTNQFCRADTYFEEHPEYFALIAGVRSKKQLCLSNPDTYRIVRDEIFELLEREHNPEAALQIVSVTQNDTILHCTCPKCAAKDIKYGSPAGSNLEFVNAIAREVKAAGYDNVGIDTFAYQYTRTAPHGIVPEDNVIVRLCSLECCFSHTLDDPECLTNLAFMNDLRNWSKICNRLYIWDYTTNYCNFVGLFPDFGVLQKNIQMFCEHNVKGIYEEGNYQMIDTDAEFGELRSYLLSRLMQDPYCDIEAEKAAFLDAFYGAGGKYIGEFLDIITENADSKHLSIYNSMKDTLSLNKKTIAQCDELWEKAKAASPDGDEGYRVKCSEISWRYWKMYNNASEFSVPSEKEALKNKLFEDIAATGITSIRECDETKAILIQLLQTVRFFFCRIVEIIIRPFVKIFVK